MAAAANAAATTSANSPSHIARLRLPTKFIERGEAVHPNPRHGASLLARTSDNTRPGPPGGLARAAADRDALQTSERTGSDGPGVAARAPSCWSPSQTRTTDRA